MPCNCILDKPTYPRNEEWGYLIWLILHTLAEKAGRQTNPISIADEQRAWPLFIKSLVPVIPCPFCRDHLQEYFLANPCQPPADYYQWKEYFRMYFYTLHESVNARLGKPKFDLAGVSTMYANSNTIQTVLPNLTKIMERAIAMGGLRLLAWKDWLKHLGMLRAAIA